MVFQQTVVYDVTAFAHHHPNPQFITHHCGRDATSLFDSAHPSSLLKIFQRRQVGRFDPNTAAAAPPEEEQTVTSGGRKKETSSNVVTGDCDNNKTSPISLAELYSHNMPTDDCWLAMYGIVYDVTAYAPFHPNPHYVTDYCGQDVTALFVAAHAKSRSIVKVVQERCVGRLLSGGGTRANGLTTLVSDNNDGHSQESN
jgi:cytochrome b involved in lipid metabolism